MREVGTRRRIYLVVHIDIKQHTHPHAKTHQVEHGLGLPELRGRLIVLGGALKVHRQARPAVIVGVADLMGGVDGWMVVCGEGLVWLVGWLVG